MKLQLNKKKLKNLSKDALILPNDMTPNIGGGATGEICQDYTKVNATCGCNSDMNACGTVITKDVFCGATGSCGCNSAGAHCTVTNTCR